MIQKIKKQKSNEIRQLIVTSFDRNLKIKLNLYETRSNETSRLYVYV